MSSKVDEVRNSAVKKRAALVIGGILVAGAVVVGAVCGSGHCSRSSSSSEREATTQLSAPTVAPTSLEPTAHPQSYNESTTAPTTGIPTATRTLAPSSTTTDPPSIKDTVFPTVIPTMEPSNDDRLSTPPTGAPIKPSNPTPFPSETPLVKPTGGPVQTTMVPTRTPSMPPVSSSPMEGAVVTYDCLFQDYGYAIDIFWSCGDEQFGEELRLHTFKRHSIGHRRVFADQLLAYNTNRQLWFNQYDSPRCIRIQNGRLRLSTDASQCHFFDLEAVDTVSTFRIRETQTGSCVTLGDDASCGDDRSTGGRECGGIDHRFLPLAMSTDCETALIFQWEVEAQTCSNEVPESACFNV